MSRWDSLLEQGCQYQGVVYRGHNPRWHHAPESGAGAARNGGRWNRDGLPALYTSERFETAWLEAQQGFPLKTQPLTLCAYEVDCERIVDLRDPATRRAAGVSAADLGCAWEDLVERDATDEAVFEDVSLALLTIRDLERVGDHAVNIVARTLYMVDNNEELIY